jgi:hypothetical protein
LNGGLKILLFDREIIMWNPAVKGVDQMASSMDLTPEQNQLLRTRLEALLTSMDQDEKIKPRPARKAKIDQGDGRKYGRAIPRARHYYQEDNVIYLQSALKLKESTEQALNEMKEQKIRKETIRQLKKQCNEFVKDYGGLITLTATLASLVSSAKDVLEALKILE